MILLCSKFGVSSFDLNIFVKRMKTEDYEKKIIVALQ